jgi:hypothetical protein
MSKKGNTRYSSQNEDSNTNSKEFFEQLDADLLGKTKKITQ